MGEREAYEEALDILSRKWCPRIVESLLRNEEAQFNELKKDIDGISNKALSESLKYLQEKEFVYKDDQRSREVYTLTEKGESLEEILNSVKSWSKRFSGDSRPEILVLEDDEEQAELYARWLKSDYTVSTANKESEFYEEFDEKNNLVLLDRDLKNTTAKELIESSERLKETPVILITGKEPGDEIVGLDISDYLLKPISEENLREAVSNVLKIAEKDEDLRELASLIQKREVLERNKSGKSDDYDKLLKRIEELGDQIDDEKIERLRS